MSKLSWLIYIEGVRESLVVFTVFYTLLSTIGIIIYFHERRASLPDFIKTMKTNIILILFGFLFCILFPGKSTINDIARIEVGHEIIGNMSIK